MVRYSADTGVVVHPPAAITLVHMIGSVQHDLSQCERFSLFQDSVIVRLDREQSQRSLVYSQMRTTLDQLYDRSTKCADQLKVMTRDYSVLMRKSDEKLKIAIDENIKLENRIKIQQKRRWVDRALWVFGALLARLIL